jgi:hypothetical protein
MSPNRKISETLLEFAEPLIDLHGDAPNKSELESVLGLACVIWNACVLDAWHGTTDNVDAMRKLLKENPDIVALMEYLIERKQKQYGDDFRAIMNEQVVEKNGELVVRAEARGNPS